MRKIKEILRLKLDARLSHEQIAAALGISKGVVTKYVGLASAAGLTLSQVQESDETQLQHRLAGPGKKPHNHVQPDFGRVHQELRALKILFEPENIGQSILALLKEHDIKPEDIDLLITGKNGDTRNDTVYQQVISAIFPTKPVANYKHLCGEYPVANSFGLWLAANILKNGSVPEVLLERAAPNLKPKKILLYNHYQNKYHSLMLLDAV